MNETQTTQPTLLETILSAINTHIDQQVEAKLNAVMQAHTTIKQIDEGFEARIQELIAEAVDDHETTQDHHTRDDVASIVEDNVQQEVQTQMRDFDFNSHLHDAITDYDFDDKIDSFDFDSKMDDWKEANDILDSDQVRELLDEILEEKINELLSKLSITVKED